MEHEQNAGGIISFYGDLIDGFILDERDQDFPTAEFYPKIFKAGTLMQDCASRSRMGRTALNVIETLYAG